MLSPEQLAAREGKLTASRVSCLMTGDEEKIFNLWRLLIGDPSYAEEDLSDVWSVQLGMVTEDLQLDWFDRKRGPVTRRGEVVKHANGWAACTLDGWSDLHNCPIETKHCGGYEPFETLVDRYQPQIHWQMIITGADKCALSIIMGAREPVVDFVERDEAYAAELMTRATAFMQCVRELRPPVALPEIAPPPPPGMTYDMEGSNSWADQAVVWITTKAARKLNEAAEKELKAMVPADAVKCTGHGVSITRNKAGALSLREQVGEKQ